MAEALELLDGAVAGALDGVLAYRGGSGLAVQLAGAEHVPGGGEDLVGDRDDRFLVAAAAGELAVALGEVGFLGACGGARGLDQGWLSATESPCVSWRTCACRRTRAGRGTRLPMRRGAWRTGTRSCPCRSRRSAPPRLAAPRRGSCTAAQPSSRKGRSAPPRARRSLGCRLRALRCARASVQAGTRGGRGSCPRAPCAAGKLLAQLALRELCERVGVAMPVDQRAHHRAARDAHHVGRDARELHAGVLQQLVQPVDRARALVDQRLAIPRQVSELTDRLGRHETASQQSARQQLRDPRRVDLYRSFARGRA